MKASDFNSIYEEKVSNKLIDIGFVKKKNNLFLIREGKVLCLLKASYHGLPIARFLLCVRHLFIRDIDTLMKNKKNLYLNNPNSYPFKLHPSQLTQKTLSNWHYKTNHVGINNYNYEVMGFGDDGLYSKDSKDIENGLENLYLRVSNFGIEWMEFLTPNEALKQLKKYNSGDKIEKLWIDDYEDFLRTIDK